MEPNRKDFKALWDFIDRVAAEVDTWPYWKRGGGFAEQEDRERDIRKAQPKPNERKCPRQ